jgi:PPK2 family polyphosphate:nucleotide phosphotransferase
MSAPVSELETYLNRLESPWRIDTQTPLSRTPAQYAPPVSPELEPDSHYQVQLDEVRNQIQPLQEKLVASKQFSILMIFQALDAAGKDGAIREVLQGLDAGGIRVASFKQPTRTELAHDFLWRTTRELPERGQIGAFNRSYYEEVLAGQTPDASLLWPARYRAIREFERHLAMSNTLVLKFWLNVSPERQALRFLNRLEDPKRFWKFSKHDIVESGHREAYEEAVLHMFNETSRDWAPWFCMPADNRWYLRWQISSILLQAMQALPLKYPEAETMTVEDKQALRQLLRQRAGLEKD